MSIDPTIAGARWAHLFTHRAWLDGERDRLLRFHERHALTQEVGFAPLDVAGRPVTGAARELYATARLVHCFAVEHLLGRPGAADIASHGMAALTDQFLDRKYGGWFAALRPDGSVADSAKSAYGHAFVILAAASATQARLDGGRQLLDNALAVVSDHLWNEDESAVIDACRQDWTITEPGYRGQNANMHLTEAYIAAAEALGDQTVQHRAERIAEKLIDQHARAWQWRVPEHFTATWQVAPRYNEDRPADPFRPSGALVGHWFEWARLVLTLQTLPASNVPWAGEAAAALFHRGIADGWDPVNGGIIYSTDFHGVPVNTDRMHWAIAEGVGAAVYLSEVTGKPMYEHWYRTFWDEIDRHVIDRDLGSWWHQCAADKTPKSDTWPGKPDLYHAWQATLYARVDTSVGLATAARLARLR